MPPPTFLSQIAKYRRLQTSASHGTALLGAPKARPKVGAAPQAASEVVHARPMELPGARPLGLWHLGQASCPQAAPAQRATRALALRPPSRPQELLDASLVKEVPAAGHGLDDIAGDQCLQADGAHLLAGHGHSILSVSPSDSATRMRLRRAAGRHHPGDTSDDARRPQQARPRARPTTAAAPSTTAPAAVRAVGPARREVMVLRRGWCPSEGKAERLCPAVQAREIGEFHDVAALGQHRAEGLGVGQRDAEPGEPSRAAGPGRCEAQGRRGRARGQRPARDRCGALRRRRRRIGRRRGQRRQRVGSKLLLLLLGMRRQCSQEGAGGGGAKREGGGRAVAGQSHEWPRRGSPEATDGQSRS
mmetsp:Transcript_33087/g.85273  ORF Transcript_33087/g.85273 Transcript_33087/m.85273 type:complete len:361 (-) Transcript_33087:14-1096(-)